VINEDTQESAQESDHEPLPHNWDDAHDFLECYVTRCIDTGDGVNDCRGGEERENEEGYVVGDPEEPVIGPLFGHEVREFVVCLGARVGLVELIFDVKDSSQD